MNTIKLRQAIRDKFAWPGGYEIYGITSDGACLCCDCMRSEYRQVARAIREHSHDGWRVDAVDCAANLDEPETCAHCNKTIS